MAIATVTPNQWARIFAPKLQAPKRKRTRLGRIAYTSRKPGRAFQGYHGPGRKTKRLKNGGITHLHDNKLGVR